MGIPARTAPKFLDLTAIRFPIGAIASILHRVSGMVLLVALPLLARSLERSLASQAQFDALVREATTGWVALPLTVGVWALVHHVFAGIRHLAMDVGIGVRLNQARASAAFASAAGVVVAAAWLLLWWLR